MVAPSILIRLDIAQRSQISGTWSARKLACHDPPARLSPLLFVRSDGSTVGGRRAGRRFTVSARFGGALARIGHESRCGPGGRGRGTV